MTRLEPHYCEADDMTFITECEYVDDRMVSQEVVGFYHGTPNETNVGLYSRRYKAEYEM